MSSTSPAVGRALDVLPYLAGRPGPVSGAAIMRDLDIPRSSAYHLLEVLTERGFVVYLADQRTYGLGVSAFEVGSAYLRHGPLEMWARPVLKQLVAQVHETSHLGILHGSETLHLLREHPTAAHMAVHSLGIGVRMPAHRPPAGAPSWPICPPPKCARCFRPIAHSSTEPEKAHVVAGAAAASAGPSGSRAGPKRWGSSLQVCSRWRHAPSTTGHPCAAFSVTRHQGDTHTPATDLVRAVRAAAQQLTSALSGRPPEGWFAA